MKAKIYLKEERIRDAFDFFDRVYYFYFLFLNIFQDKSGAITMNELQAVLSGEELKLTEENIKLLIAEVDINKDD